MLAVHAVSAEPSVPPALAFLNAHAGLGMTLHCPEAAEHAVHAVAHAYYLVPAVHAESHACCHEPAVHAVTVPPA